MHLFEDSGLDTGMDLAAVLDAARLSAELVGHGLPSKLLKVDAARRFPA